MLDSCWTCFVLNLRRMVGGDLTTRSLSGRAFASRPSGPVPSHSSDRSGRRVSVCALKAKRQPSLPGSPPRVGRPSAPNPSLVSNHILGG